MLVTRLACSIAHCFDTLEQKPPGSLAILVTHRPSQQQPAVLAPYNKLAFLTVYRAVQVTDTFYSPIKRINNTPSLSNCLWHCQFRTWISVNLVLLCEELFTCLS